MINDFVLLRFRARAPEDLSAIEVIFFIYFIYLYKKPNFFYLTDKDDPERVHYPRLPGQVDPDDQVRVYDACRVGGTESRQGRTARTRRQLLWQHLLLSLPEVRQERGQETGGGWGDLSRVEMSPLCIMS